MRIRQSYIFALIITLFFFNFRNKSNEVTISPENQHPVIVELFTSQGCSSCPSADKLLSKIIDKAENEDLPIFGLSFHVDYWNRLGWKDVFSNKSYTDRQYDYAQSFHSSSVYTPQMVVNGKKEFVGSNESKAWNAINNELAATQQIAITINKLVKTDQQLRVDYSIDIDNTNSLMVNAALVERNLSVEIKRGENGGLTLKHDNVVKQFQTTNLLQNGSFNLSTNSLSKINSGAVILYVQDAKSLQILGAAKVELSDTI